MFSLLLAVAVTARFFLYITDVIPCMCVWYFQRQDFDLFILLIYIQIVIGTLFLILHLCVWVSTVYIWLCLSITISSILYNTWIFKRLIKSILLQLNEIHTLLYFNYCSTEDFGFSKFRQIFGQVTPDTLDLIKIASIVKILFCQVSLKFWLML